MMSNKAKYEAKWARVRWILKQDYLEKHDRAFLFDYLKLNHELYKNQLNRLKKLDEEAHLRKQKFNNVLDRCKEIEFITEDLVEHLLVAPKVGEQRAHRLVAQTMARKIKFIREEEAALNGQ